MVPFIIKKHEKRWRARSEEQCSGAPPRNGRHIRQSSSSSTEHNFRSVRLLLPPKHERSVLHLILRLDVEGDYYSEDDFFNKNSAHHK